MALAATFVMAFGSPSTAQPSSCDLVAPWELSEAAGAAFGPGEPTEQGCTWRTETRDGHILTISLDVSTQPPIVGIETGSPSIDAGALSQAIAALAAERIATGDTAPLAPPLADAQGDLPDLCALFPAEDIAARLGVTVKPYGHMGENSCGYISDEFGRALIDVLVTFEADHLGDILRDWPDALEAEVAGLPALEYGWDLGSSKTSYVSVETDAGLLTAKVGYDDTDLDPAAVARELVEEVLAAMGHTSS